MRPDFKEGDECYVKLGDQLVKGIILRVGKQKVDVGHYITTYVESVRMGGPDEPEWVTQDKEVTYKKVSRVPKRKVFTCHEF